jgi:hypothetical protein
VSNPLQDDLGAFDYFVEEIHFQAPATRDETDGRGELRIAYLVPGEQEHPTARPLRAVSAPWSLIETNPELDAFAGQLYRLVQDLVEAGVRAQPGPHQPAPEGGHALWMLEISDENVAPTWTEKFPLFTARNTLLLRVDEQAFGQLLHDILDVACVLVNAIHQEGRGAQTEVKR